MLKLLAISNPLQLEVMTALPLVPNLALCFIPIVPWRRFALLGQLWVEHAARSAGLARARSCERVWENGQLQTDSAAQYRET